MRRSLLAANLAEAAAKASRLPSASPQSGLAEVAVKATHRRIECDRSLQVYRLKG